jgi:hypothetical protein
MSGDERRLLSSPGSVLRSPQVFPIRSCGPRLRVRLPSDASDGALATAETLNALGFGPPLRWGRVKRPQSGLVRRSQKKKFATSSRHLGEDVSGGSE